MKPRYFPRAGWQPIPAGVRPVNPDLPKAGRPWSWGGWKPLPPNRFPRPVEKKLILPDSRAALPWLVDHPDLALPPEAAGRLWPAPAPPARSTNLPSLTFA